MPGNLGLAVHLFLQLTVILIVCRVAGGLLRHLGQTQVVSEMVAGVLLGPSLLGLLWPEMQAFLFPPNVSMSILYALSQVGLVLYMFVIGLNLSTRLLADHSRDAFWISVSGVAAPVVMGGAMGVMLADDPALFTSGVHPWQAALFMASAMAITAFPMLARILYESGMAQTRVGTLAIGAAAFDDAAAWCLLAAVVASLRGAPAIAVLAVGGGAVYAGFMATIGRRLFRRFETVTERDGGVRAETLAVLLTVLVACAWLTDLVGIYSVFGAFICGLVMPRGRFAREVTGMIEPATVSLLLPIFFVYSGLNTQIALLVSPTLLGIAVVAVVVAFVCKGGGGCAAARLVGASWREAAAIGTLMNARGLMELILINIALENGLITPGLFAILVMMAILTTLAASPIFHRLMAGAAPAPNV